MSDSTRHRMALRGSGRRKVGLMTAGAAATGAVLAGVLGVVFATTTGASQSSTTSSNSSPGSSDSQNDGSSGAQLQPPAQAPGTGSFGRSHAGSGAS